MTCRDQDKGTANPFPNTFFQQCSALSGKVVAMGRDRLYDMVYQRMHTRVLLQSGDVESELYPFLL
jgi:hypothetical protein